MNTKTKFGISIGIIILLVGVLIWSQHRLRTAETIAIEYEEALMNEKSAYSAGKKSLAEKNDEIYRLKQQNERLRDSIKILKTEVGKLNAALGKQGREILENNEKIKEMQIREDSLVKEIGRMLGLESNNKVAINKLENERTNINENLAALYEENEYLKDSIVTSTVQKEEVKEKLTLQQQIYEITNNTIVRFNSVQVKKDNGSPARNSKRWKATEIDLELFHPKGDILENEIFLVTLRDLDKNIPILPREANKGKDTQGVPFSFSGNPVKTIRYPNYQDKESDNYAIQIFYIKNGKKYALNKGGIQHISFRK